MKHFRSLLFVPGNRPEWMDKAPQYGADGLILDLEDAVPVAAKAAARDMVRAAIGRLHARNVPVVVRVNGIGTGLTAADIAAVVTPGLVAIMVPKLERPEEIRTIDAWVGLYERRAGLDHGNCEIIALPETALGILNVFQIASASPRVGNIVGGVYSRSGDIAKAIGFQWTEEGNETLYLASHLLYGARAAGIRYPLASSAQEFTRPELVRAKYQRARNIGFRGALVIHPSAVAIANDVFSSPKEGEKQ